MNRSASASASVLQSSRREALFVMLLWLASCIYTVGYAALFAYRQDPVPRLLWGMPEWIVLGVLAPWAVCLVITCWYALWGIRDEDLGEEAPGTPGSQEAAHG